MTFAEKGTMAILGAAAFVFMCLIILGSKDYESKRNYIDDAEGFTYYYNGEEVDGDNVDLDLYRWTVDKDKKKVYLTDRVESDTNIVPMILPVR